jgi:hypothetical protein
MIHKPSHISFLITNLKFVYIHTENALRQGAGINRVPIPTFRANLTHYSSVVEATLEADTRPAGQEIVCILWNQKSYYHIQIGTPLRPIYIQTNQSTNAVFLSFFFLKAPFWASFNHVPPPLRRTCYLRKRGAFFSYCWFMYSKIFILLFYLQ